MSVQQKLILTLFLFLQTLPVWSKQQVAQDDSKEELVKELHFWESMKAAQEKEYRALQQQNKRLRLDQYEAMGLIQRSPASGTSLSSQLTRAQRAYYEKLKTALSQFEHVTIREELDSVEIPLSSFGLFRYRLRELGEVEVNRLIPFLKSFARTLIASEYWKNIEGIEVKVHASPVHNQQFISPQKHLPPHAQEAYLFNLKLTSQRAREIAEVFYRSDFQDDKKLKELATKVRATGESFRNPVLNKRAPVRLNDLDVDCQIYHCQASRRLELSLIKKASL